MDSKSKKTDVNFVKEDNRPTGHNLTDKLRIEIDKDNRPTGH